LAHLLSVMKRWCATVVLTSLLRSPLGSHARERGKREVDGSAQGEKRAPHGSWDCVLFSPGAPSLYKGRGAPLPLHQGIHGEREAARGARVGGQGNPSRPKP
jgi:hypothetical protein